MDEKKTSAIYKEILQKLKTNIKTFKKLYKSFIVDIYGVYATQSKRINEIYTHIAQFEDTDEIDGLNDHFAIKESFIFIYILRLREYYEQNVKYINNSLGTFLDVIEERDAYKRFMFLIGSSFDFKMYWNNLQHTSIENKNKIHKYIKIIYELSSKTQSLFTELDNEYNKINVNADQIINNIESIVDDPDIMKEPVMRNAVHSICTSLNTMKQGDLLSMFADKNKFLDFASTINENITSKLPGDTEKKQLEQSVMKLTKNMMGAICYDNEMKNVITSVMDSMPGIKNKIDELDKGGEEYGFIKEILPNMISDSEQSPPIVAKPKTHKKKKHHKHHKHHGNHKH